MKKTFVICALLLFATGFAQEKMVTKTGKITFEASVPSFEEVKAKNDNVTCVLNSKTGEIASLAMIKGFRFKVALMEEHFNENYMESDKYPKASFRGKIENFELSQLTGTAKEYKISGKLELHGKSKDVACNAKIRQTENGVEIKSDFVVNASDFDIAIPAVIKNKVSNKVSISTLFTVNKPTANDSK